MKNEVIKCQGVCKVVEGLTIIGETSYKFKCSVCGMALGIPKQNSMTQKEIADKASCKTMQVCTYIKTFIGKGKHSEKGAINFSVLSDRTGIKNLGKVLGRKGVSLTTIFRVLEAIKVLCLENGVDYEPLNEKVCSLFK